MIDRAALFASRDRWNRKGHGLFTATFAEEHRAVKRLGRRGFDRSRWLEALAAVWNGAADDWMPQVERALTKGAVIDAGLAEELLTILAGKADAIVEVSEAEWLLLGDEAFAASEGRVATMAATESVQAHGWSQSNVAKAQPLILLKIWQAITDDRTRATHLTANGQRRRINDPFSVGGALLQWPADAGGPAGEVINCRCWEDYEVLRERPRSG
jgi:hypothetical protein